MTAARPSIRARRRSTTLWLAMACGVPAIGSAQLVNPKTIPIAQSDQFNIFPAANAGLGGASIALADSLLDPWINPARVTATRTPQLFSSPTFYSISEHSGAGRTLPMGASGPVGTWNAGVIGALQQIDKGDRQQWAATPISDASGVNQLIAGVLGRRFESSGLAVGGGVFAAGLDAVDGVDLLYSSASRIEQFGGLFDARLGVTKTWADQRVLDVVAIYDRFDMTHDVTFTTWMWDSVRRTSQLIDRTEHNRDRTVIWGGHAKYSRALSAPGWRVGWTGTFNKLEHPKIPNYDIMNIPRDPGSTRAVNVGVGLSRAKGPTTFAVDAIYEPMWSATWADAARDTAIVGGGTIPQGGKTVENDFTFSNAIVRMGIGREVAIGTPQDPRSLGLQFGLAMHAIDYRLRQVDNVQRRARTQNEDWVEWSPTVGITLRFSDLELRYSGRRTMGVGRPGNAGIGILAEGDVGSPRGGTIIAAPSAPISMTDVHIVTHQIGFSIPIR